VEGDLAIGQTNLFFGVLAMKDTKSILPSRPIPTLSISLMRQRA
jgi:hypothetical protein